MSAGALIPICNHHGANYGKNKGYGPSLNAYAEATAKQRWLKQRGPEGMRGVLVLLCPCYTAALKRCGALRCSGAEALTREGTGPYPLFAMPRNATVSP